MRNKAYNNSLTFLLFFASFSKMEKVAKIRQKVKAIVLLFCRFSPFFKNEKRCLTWTKGYKPSFFSIFCPFSKNEKVAKIRRKVKAIAYFFPFFARFSKMEKVAKIGRIFPVFCLFFKNEKSG
jgi:hypothetical protein